MGTSASERRDAWRETVLGRLTADIDQGVWEWIVPARAPKKSFYEAFIAAAGKHKRVALAAAKRASELRMGRDDHRERQRLYDRLRDALRCTDVGSVALGKDSNLLVLLVHWLGMTLEDLLPNRENELRLPVAEAKLVQAKSTRWVCPRG